MGAAKVYNPVTDAWEYVGNTGPAGPAGADGAGYDSAVTISAKTDSYELVLADAGTMIEMGKGRHGEVLGGAPELHPGVPHRHPHRHHPPPESVQH